MKKASRALFLVAVALCAVVLGRMACKGLRSGLPDAYAGESRVPAVSAASEVAGVVTKVADGDTIRVTDAQGVQHKIRLLDIDAPESSQTFGGESTARLKSLIGGKTVRVTYSDTDKYGRLLAKGVAVACVGYRYIWETERGKDFPPVKGCIDDVAAAIRFLKDHADEWGFDVSRIGLSGGSAGACTVLILSYRDGNALGVKALAPVSPQTSMDPAEMRKWIPNSIYGAHAFGYKNFDDWLAHRGDHPEWIAAYSPAALARAIDPAKAPTVILRARRPKEGELPKDPTHAPEFSWRFSEICAERGLPCDIKEVGNSFLDLAAAL